MKSRYSIAFASVFFATIPLWAGPVFDDGNVLKPVSSTKMEAEIVAFMPGENLLFVAGDEKLSILDIRNPAKVVVKSNLALQEKQELSSVAVSGPNVAVASPGNDGGEGFLRIFEYADGSLKPVFESKTCEGLDMVTFSPDGKLLVGACEGEPGDNYSRDAEGRVLIASVGKSGWKNPEIKLVDFKGLDEKALMKAGVRNLRKGKPLALSLEPEYVTISEDSKTAWVSLQENNAMAQVDLVAKKILKVFPLGTMDFSKDAEIAIRRGKKIEFEHLPLFGLRQPDGIAVKTMAGMPLVFTADEGADVDVGSFKDSESIKDKLKHGEADESVFGKDLQEALEKADLSTDRCGVKNGKDTCAFVYGSRSFSIFDGASGSLLWTSRDMIEKKAAEVAPSYFNWNSKKGKVKVNARSGDKGSAPESIVLGEVGGKIFAFVGLERMNGVMAFDVTDPKAPAYAGYYMDPEERGPEGIKFIPADKSPSGKPLLVVCYEFSGHLTIYEVTAP